MKYLLFVLLIFLSSCVAQPHVVLQEQKIVVEVMKTPEEKAVGLMYRESLGEDRGMLFVYETEQQLQFWMKNTLLPLDMIFLTEDLVVVDVIQAEPCKEDPCRTYGPEEETKYVLEVNKGYAEKNNIKKGSKAILNI